MLQIITSPKGLDFGPIMQVYHQSLQKNGMENYPELDVNRQLLEAEQDFYLYLKTFLREKDSVIALWIAEGKHVSALRGEPYRDGFLIEGLETVPQFRRMGFAKQLLSATLKYLESNNIHKIYSHIHKDNIPSIQTHISCGFVLLTDYAAYVDGSVDRQSFTYIKNIP